MAYAPGGRAAGSAISAPDERTLYGIYKTAMAGHTDEWEAQLTSDWARFAKGAETYGRKIRDGLIADVERIKNVDKVLGPEDLTTIMDIRARTDETLWDWQANQFRRLGLWPSKDEKAELEVFNRYWNITDSTGATMVGKAREKIEEAAKSADIDPDDISDEWDESHVTSWADNVIRAIEQATHQMSAHILDATSGVNALEALEETAEMFEPPMQILELSFTTHPRAAFRTGLGLIGREMEAEEYVYHLPTAARTDADPFGWGANQHGKIRTAAEWEDIRQSMDHKRPGSYVWSTGFHVGDRGYLLPIPPDKAEGAVAWERRERQKWLERLRKRAG
jgi:hypothetical protein